MRSSFRGVARDVARALAMTNEPQRLGPLLLHGPKFWNEARRAAGGQKRCRDPAGTFAASQQPERFQLVLSGTIEATRVP